MSEQVRTTVETTQPWVVYHYGLTHDRWWPFWNSTRVLGRARIRLTCAVCGVGPVPVPASGRHPERERFLAEHTHPDRGHPMSWAMPLLNPQAHQGGMDIDLLAARLEADLNDAPRVVRGDGGEGSGE